MVEIISFKGHNYPKFQSQGNASQFSIPFAKHVCKGIGFDIGCNREEWSFPGSIMIDPELNTGHALRFPDISPDYIFSSHCLEHIHGWVDVLDHWYNKLKEGGVLFLYLPDFSQEYWLPWNNRKHVNIFTPKILLKYFQDKGFVNIFCSGIDLNNSFIIFGEKPHTI